MTTLALRVRKEGRIAILTRARKHHRCAICQEYILPRTQYYSVTVSGSGLGGIKFPDRVKPEHIEDYFEKVRKSRELL